MKKRWDIPLSIMFLLTVTGVLIIVSLLAPVLFPVDLGATDLPHRLAPPSIFGMSDSGYLLGTDYLGRDFAIRLL